MKILLKIFICLLFLNSCSSVNIKDIPDSNPKFVLEEYFAGATEAWGIVLDRSGVPIKQFNVKLNGTKTKENILVLDEQFTYSDGKKEERVWTITKTSEDNYEGTAKDVNGSAVGISKGHALNWKYSLKVPVDGKDIDINFNDWMFLQSDGSTLINKAVMTKYGIYVGEILIFFRK